MVKVILNVAGAVFGLLGTWLMSRRYAKQFARSLVLALVSPVFFLIGKGAHLRRFWHEKISANRDLPDSSTDMALGLTLLFWAFFLQLISFLLDLKH